MNIHFYSDLGIFRHEIAMYSFKDFFLHSLRLRYFYRRARDCFVDMSNRLLTRRDFLPIVSKDTIFHTHPFMRLII